MPSARLGPGNSVLCRTDIGPPLRRWTINNKPISPDKVTDGDAHQEGINSRCHAELSGWPLQTGGQGGVPEELAFGLRPV